MAYTSASVCLYCVFSLKDLQSVTVSQATLRGRNGSSERAITEMT